MWPLNDPKALVMTRRYRVAEAASLFGVSRSQIYLCIRQGLVKNVGRNRTALLGKDLYNLWRKKL